MIDFSVWVFSSYAVAFLIAHIFATILGMGGALISDILFFRFLSDGKISRKEMDVLHVMKTVVLLSLIVIILTGGALVVPHPQRYLSSAPFLLKMTIVGVLTCNGIALHAYVAPFLLRMNLARPERRHRTWRHIAFALGGISAVSWLSAFLTAMTKSHITWSYTELLACYTVLLMITVMGTQCMECVLSARLRRRG